MPSSMPAYAAVPSARRSASDHRPPVTNGIDWAKEISP